MNCRWHRLLGCLVLGLGLVLGQALGAPACAAAPGEVCPGGLVALLKPFRTLVGVKVDFVEEKQIALLRKPLVNRGTVVFMAPANLVRRVDAPAPSALWLKGKELWVRDRTGERKLDVANWGPANVLINSFLFVLQGDVESLQHHYTIDLSCEKGGWRMVLVPRQPELAKILRHMVIAGRGTSPESLELLDGAGDRSLTRFAQPNPKARYTSAQLKAFFVSVAATP